MSSGKRAPTPKMVPSQKTDPYCSLNGDHPLFTLSLVCNPSATPYRFYKPFRQEPSKKRTSESFSWLEIGGLGSCSVAMATSISATHGFLCFLEGLSLYGPGMQAAPPWSSSCTPRWTRRILGLKSEMGWCFEGARFEVASKGKNKRGRLTSSLRFLFWHSQRCCVLLFLGNICFVGLKGKPTGNG